MKIERYDKTVKLWLSASDTYNWAHRAGSCWPCSYLSGKRLFADFDNGDLVDILVNGKPDDGNTPGDEFTAICSDALRDASIDPPVVIDI